MKTFLNILATLTLALAQVVAQAPTRAGTPSANDANGNPPGLQVGDPVEAGKPIHTVNIVVPSDFQKKNSFVILHGTIAADGSLKELKAVTGEPALISPSLDAVQQWLYSPCTLNGAPIDVPIYVAISFSNGAVNASLEPDLPFPTGPRKPIPDQIAEGQLFRVRQGVTPPQVVYDPRPQYSKTAIVAKFQHTVIVGAIIGSDGKPQDVWIAQQVGLGLDQKAIETVRQWKFKPAIKDGKPVAVPINIQTEFYPD
jgi:TonB family protein